MIERSLVLLKPDTLQRNLVGEIIYRFERTGLKLVGMKMVMPTEKQSRDHYYKDDAWFEMVGKRQKEDFLKKGIKVTKTELELGRTVQDQLVEYLTLNPIVALVYEGHNAVGIIRKIVGATNPFEAVPGTIRGDFSIETYKLADNSGRAVQNLIHASGAVDEAEREIPLWFNENEIHTWKRLDESLLYRGIENCKNK
jgi:nucleoside-diphosphate kinase